MEVNITSSPAVAEKPLCTVGQFWVGGGWWRYTLHQSLSVPENSKHWCFKRSIHFYTKTVTLRFLALLMGLEAMYAVHLRLIGKPVAYFLLVIVELFSLGVRVEVLRANIDWKSPFLKGGGSLWPKISGRRGRPPRTICARLDRLVNALQCCCWTFSYKETLYQTFFEKRPKNGQIAFLRPRLGLRGNVRCSSYAHCRLPISGN